MTRRAMAFAACVAALAATSAARETGAPDAADFVEVAGGVFQMGADRARDPEAFDNERWSATAGEGAVDVPTFHIARHEVQVEQFATFVRERRWPIDPRALQGPPSQPVTFVSWPDAVAYCRWLETSFRESLSTAAAVRSKLDSGWRVTLPTEAEWEKAARMLDRAHFSWGAVSEWTSSPYQPYPYDASDDRSTLEADALWVIRGGISTEGQRPRATARIGADPGARRAFIGFRVALSPPRSHRLRQ